LVVRVLVVVILPRGVLNPGNPVFPIQHALEGPCVVLLQPANKHQERAGEGLDYGTESYRQRLSAIAVTAALSPQGQQALT